MWEPSQAAVPPQEDEDTANPHDPLFWEHLMRWVDAEEAACHGPPPLYLELMYYNMELIIVELSMRSI